MPNHHEVTLVQFSFDFYMIEAKLQTLIGDKAYDRDALDEALKKQGIEMIAAHRLNRKLKTRKRRRRDLGQSRSTHSFAERRWRAQPRHWDIDVYTAPTGTN